MAARWSSPRGWSWSCSWLHQQLMTVGPEFEVRPLTMTSNGDDAGPRGPLAKQTRGGRAQLCTYVGPEAARQRGVVYLDTGLDSCRAQKRRRRIEFGSQRHLLIATDQ